MLMKRFAMAHTMAIDAMIDALEFRIDGGALSYSRSARRQRLSV